MIIMVICAVLASAVVGMLIGQMGGGGNRDIEPVSPTEAGISTPVTTPLDLPPFFRTEAGISTPVATPLDLPPFFRAETARIQPAARLVAAMRRPKSQCLVVLIHVDSVEAYPDSGTDSHQ
jgi:hypothetical protein